MKGRFSVLCHKNFEFVFLKLVNIHFSVSLKRKISNLFCWLIMKETVEVTKTGSKFLDKEVTKRKKCRYCSKVSHKAFKISSVKCYIYF